MSARDDFIRATYILAKSNPQAWASFIEAFKAYTWEELEKGLTSPTNDAYISLGMGRRMRNLRDDFVGIEGLMDKITPNGRKHSRS